MCSSDDATGGKCTFSTQHPNIVYMTVLRHLNTISLGAFVIGNLYHKIYEHLLCFKHVYFRWLFLFHYIQHCYQLQKGLLGLYLQNFAITYKILYIIVLYTIML